MQLDDVRRAVRNTPFVPFQLKMADGSVYTVRHPEYIAVPPDGSRITVYTGNKDESSWLDCYLIEAIDFPDAASTNGSN